jgi:hypothetical protein
MSDGAKVLLGVLGIFGVSVLAGVAGLVLVYAVATADEPDSGVDRDKALAELRARDRAREERLQEARRALPPEGAVPPDWTLDVRLFKVPTEGGEHFRQLVLAYVVGGGDIADAALQEVRANLAETASRRDLTDRERRTDPNVLGEEQIVAAIEETVLESPALERFAAAARAGLAVRVLKEPADYRSDHAEAVADRRLEVAALLAARAVALARRGEAEAALDAADALYRLGAAAGEEPLLQACVHRNRINRLGDQALMAALDALPHAHPREAAFLDYVPARQDTVRLRRALREEEAVGGLLEEIRSESGVPQFLRGWLARDAMQAAEEMDALLAESLPKAIEAVADAKRDFSPGHLGRMIAAAELSDAVVAHAADAARADALRLALALRRYKAERGEYPEALDALAPAYLERLPRCPLTGEDYPYRRVEGGFELPAPETDVALSPHPFWRARR